MLNVDVFKIFSFFREYYLNINACESNIEINHNAMLNL